MVVGGGLVTVVSGSCDPMDYSLDYFPGKNIGVGEYPYSVLLYIYEYLFRITIQMWNYVRSICTYQQYRKVSVSPIFLPI